MKALRWFFNPPEKSASFLRVIAWWELRRIFYNLILFFYGMLAYAVFAVCIYSSGVLKDSEDAVEPLMFFMTPILANICYTAGWLVDVPCRFFISSFNPKVSSVLLAAGLLFSLFVFSIPAIFWAGYRVFQMLHLIH